MFNKPNDGETTTISVDITIKQQNMFSKAVLPSLLSHIYSGHNTTLTHMLNGIAAFL